MVCVYSSNKNEDEEFYISIELLQKMRLFVKAKQVTKHCIEKEKVPLHYNPKEFDGTIILTAQAPAAKRSAPVTSPTTSNKPPPMLKDFICTIWFVSIHIIEKKIFLILIFSRIPCRGIFTFCGVCFHGGHIDHIQKWFDNHDECPYGCGHRCRDRYSQNHPNGMMMQRLITKSSIVFQ